MTNRLLVTLCTYNERQNLENLVPVIFRYAPDAHIVIIDDNSPDGTGRFADELAAENPAIKVLHRTGKQGLGSATLLGFNYGIDNDYELLVNLDADFSHHPQHIPAMLECMDRADVAIGSRYIKGGGVEGWGLKRHFMSKSINLYARLLLGLKTNDNSGSFRCYRVARLAELDLAAVRSKGYSFQEEILYRLERIDCRFEETPIYFANRRFGETKINMQEAVSAMVVLFQLAIDRIRRVPVTKTTKA
jgi:dolichol-phosphate mannosyltransferase